MLQLGSMYYLINILMDNYLLLLMYKHIHFLHLSIYHSLLSLNMMFQHHHRRNLHLHLMLHIYSCFLKLMLNLLVQSFLLFLQRFEYLHSLIALLLHLFLLQHILKFYYYFLILHLLRLLLHINYFVLFLYLLLHLLLVHRYIYYCNLY